MTEFFTQNDLDAFKDDLAESDNETVINNREVTRSKFIDLNDNKLESFMETKELFPHYIRENLTSDIHPSDSNGGYVDHIRMGYGKSDYDIDTLSRLAMGATHLGTGYSSSDTSFNSISQIQLSLDMNSLTTSFYLDHLGWIEQINIEKKMKYKDDYIHEFYNAINSTVELGYNLYLYAEEGPLEYDDVYEFISDLLNFIASGEHPSIHIFKCIDIDSEENSSNYIGSYLKEEFENLLPLYNFISWNPTDNNYIWI